MTHVSAPPTSRWRGAVLVILRVSDWLRRYWRALVVLAAVLTVYAAVCWVIVTNDSPWPWRAAVVAASTLLMLRGLMLADELASQPGRRSPVRRPS